MTETTRKKFIQVLNHSAGLTTVTDDDGRGYKALSNQKIWEAGWCAAMIKVYNSVMTETYSKD